MQYPTSLTLSEVESRAYAAGDMATVAMLRRTEEEMLDTFETTMSPDHETAVDNLARVNDALEACVDAMNDAEKQLDDLAPEVDGKTVEHAPAGFDALSDAEDALKAPSYEYDETLRAKLAKVKSERDAARAESAKLRDELSTRGQVLNAAHGLLMPYRRSGKAMPKWADALHRAVTTHKASLPN